MVIAYSVHVSKNDVVLKGERGNNLVNAKWNKVLRICSTVIVFVMVLLALLLYGTRWFGLTPYAVVSPSMEPKYPTGSLIYVKKAQTKELKENDVITFQMTDRTTATHRIIEIVNGENGTSFRTKGDNNDLPDGPLVAGENVVGKAVCCIPLLGYFAQYMQTRAGNVVIICFGVAIILFVVSVDVVTEKQKEKRGSQN